MQERNMNKRYQAKGEGGGGGGGVSSHASSFAFTNAYMCGGGGTRIE